MLHKLKCFFTGKKNGKLTGKKPVKNKVVFFTGKKTLGITIC